MKLSGVAGYSAIAPKFDSMTGSHEIKIAFLWNFDCCNRSFVSLVDISLLSSLLAIFSSYFKIVKQAPGQNHENTICQPGS